MNEIRNALLTQAVGAIFLTLLLRALFARVGSRPFYRWWTLAWGAFTLFLLVSAFSFYLGTEVTSLKRLVQLVSVSSGMLAVVALIVGVQDVRDPAGPSVDRARRWLLPAGALVAVASWACGMAPGVTPILSAAIRQAPRQLLGSLAFLYAAMTFLRLPRRPRSQGYVVLGVVCCIWAVSQALYGLLSVDTILSRAGFGHPFSSIEPMLRVQLSLLDLVWLGGIAVGMVLLLLDQYEEQTAELRQATAAYRTLIETSPIAILSLDVHGKVQLCNPAAEHLIGLPATQIQGHSPPVFDDADGATWAQLQQGRGFQAVDARMARADGTFLWATIKAAPLRDASHRVIGAVALAADQTGRKQLEERLRHVEKMDAIGQLAGGIAHDFNNLLTAIISGAHLLQFELGAGHPALLEVDEIQSAAGRASDLTRRLLAFSRRQITQPVQLPVNAVLEDLDRLLQRLLGGEAVLQLELADDLPPAWVDQGEFEQTVTNLCVNARDASGRGGPIVVSTALVHAAEPLPGVFANRSGEFIRLDVRDAGSGMPPEVLHRIFEPYFTTKSVGKGTGLGLATVYSIVDKAEGQLQVESVLGRGTTVSVYFRTAHMAVPAPVA